MDVKLELGLKHIESFLQDYSNTSITYSLFKHILENFTTKSINVNSLLEKANTDTRSFINLIEEIQPFINDR